MNENTLISMYRYKDFYEVCNEIDFNYVIIKGEALSIQNYNKEGKRISGDIDILVSPRNLKKLDKILNDKGYKTPSIDREKYLFFLSNSHQLQPYLKKECKVPIVIDVNFDIFWGEYDGKRIDIDEFIDDAIDIRIYDCGFKTLSIYKAFIYLVLHGYKDLNSIYLLSTRKQLNINVLKDLYDFIKNNHKELDLNKLYELCHGYEIIEYVYYMMYYISKLFEDEVIEQYLMKFKSKKVDELIDFYGLSNEERKKWIIPFELRKNVNDLNDYLNLDEEDIKKIKINNSYFKGKKYEE